LHRAKVKEFLFLSLVLIYHIEHSRLCSRWYCFQIDGLLI
jgi:hypothetical protein